MILFKWCKRCGKVTKHEKLWAYLYEKFVVLCENAKEHNP